MSTPDRYAVIGYPVKHSRSPFIHAMFARQTAQDMTYQLLETPPEKFHTTVEEFFASGGKGLNVTVPHKQVAFEMMRYRSPRAEFAGAVNTISLHDNELMGDNTDGVGLLIDLSQNLHFPLREMRVLLLGAGGAARGVIAPLLQEQPAELVIANRNVERADQLVEEFMTLGSLNSVSFSAIEPPAFDLIINATSASLQGEMPALPAGIVDSHTLCYDMAYGKDDTVFTRWAREQGAEQAVQGWGMLVEQAAESFYIWRGVHPDTSEVLKALLGAAGS